MVNKNQTDRQWGTESDSEAAAGSSAPGAMLRHVAAVVLGPMTPILLLIGATFFLRWFDGKYGLGVGVDVRPTPEQLPGSQAGRSGSRCRGCARRPGL